MKFRSRQIAVVLLLITVMVGLSGHVAHAGDIVQGIDNFAGKALCLTTGIGCITQVAAWLVDAILQTMAWLLFIAGLFLNFSMNLTLHMKDFIENTTGIYTVWKAIRDISGMFIIFLLLYAAIRMILGQDAKMKQLITTVVVAGVLINFSFFITSLGIDLSNIVSLQLYNTIAAPNSLDASKPLSMNTTKGGGISDTFMGALKINNFYDPKTNILKLNVGTGASDILQVDNVPPLLRIIYSGTILIMILLTTTLSFFAIALACIARVVVLILLLGFSPIYFASFAIPSSDIKKYSTKWIDLYKSQLIFLPVYLLLTYFALSVLSTTKLFNTSNSLLSATNSWQTNFLLLTINAIFVIFMLNAPLVAALGIGAIVPGWAKKVGAGALWSKLGGMVKGAGIGAAGFASGYAGRNTIGRGAALLDKKIGNTSWGNKLVSRDIRAATLGKAAGGKYGGSRSFEETNKENLKVANKEKEIERGRQMKSVLDDMTAGLPPRTDPSDPSKLLIDTVMGNMNEKEKLGLGAKAIISNPEILKRMKDKDFEAIKKAEEGFTDEEKKQVSDARGELLTKSSAVPGNAGLATVKKLIENMNDDQWKSMKKSRVKALSDAVTAGNKDVVKVLMKDMDGKELKSLEEDPANVGLLTNSAVVENYTPGQLDSMFKEGLSKSIRVTIGTQINATIDHKAKPYINKPANVGDWT